MTVIVHATRNCFKRRKVNDDTARVYGRGTRSRIFHSTFTARITEKDVVRDNRIPVDLRLSSGIIACARRVRERACAVDRQSKNWFLDRRSAVSIPEQVVFMSLFVRRIPVSTVVDNTQIRLDSSGCTRYALSPNFLRMRIPERCERGPTRFEIRGVKNPMVRGEVNRWNGRFH